VGKLRRQGVIMRVWRVVTGDKTCTFFQIYRRSVLQLLTCISWGALVDRPQLYRSSYWDRSPVHLWPLLQIPILLKKQVLVG
jgi:hypothetical protein